MHFLLGALRVKTGFTVFVISNKIWCSGLNFPLQQAISEREQLQQQNYQLQHKLADYFRKKKADESKQEYDKNFTDQEQRYLKYMGK